MDIDRALLIFPGDDASRITKQGVVLGEQESEALFDKFSDDTRSAFAAQVSNGWALTKFDVSGLGLSGTKTRPGWFFNYDGEVSLLADRYSLVGKLYDVELLRLEAQKGNTVSLSGDGQASAQGQAFAYSFTGTKISAPPGRERNAFGDDAVVFGEDQSDALFSRLSDEVRAAFASKIDSGYILSEFDIADLRQSGASDPGSWKFKYDGKIAFVADRYELVGRLFGVEVLRRVAKEGDLVALSGVGEAEADRQEYSFRFVGTPLSAAPGKERGAFGDDAVVMGDVETDALLARLSDETRMAFASKVDSSFGLAQFDSSDFVPSGTGEKSWWQFKYRGELTVSADRFSLAGRLLGIDLLRLEASEGDTVAFSGGGKATGVGPDVDFSFWGSGLDVVASGDERVKFGSGSVVIGTPEAAKLLSQFASMAEQKFTQLPLAPWSLQAFEVADFTSRNQQSNGTWAFNYTASLALNEDTYVQRDVVLGTPVLELKTVAGTTVDLRRSGVATEGNGEVEFAFNFDIAALSSELGQLRASFPANAVVFGTPEHDALLASPKVLEESIGKAVVAFYDQKGEWSGTFRLRSILKIKLTFLSSSEVRADVEYVFQCLDGKKKRSCGGQNDGVDKRWFLVRKSSSGAWVGESMGGHMSAEF